MWIIAPDIRSHKNWSSSIAWTSEVTTFQTDISHIQECFVALLTALIIYFLSPLWKTQFHLWSCHEKHTFVLHRINTIRYLLFNGVLLTPWDHLEVCNLLHCIRRPGDNNNPLSTTFDVSVTLTCKQWSICSHHCLRRGPNSHKGASPV